MDTQGITSVRSIVSKVKMLGNITEDADMKAFQLTLDGIKEMSLFKMTSVNEVKCKIDELGRIDLPIDYIKFVAVGVPVNGYFYTFTNEKGLVRSSDRTYYYESVSEEYGEGRNFEVPIWDRYGKGGGTNKVYFYLNERDRYIQLTDFKGEKCTLKYISSGVSNNRDEVFIPVMYEQAIIAYVLWKLVAYDMEVPLHERRERERLYAEELRSIDLLQGPSLDEILDTIYSTQMQTIKRL